jgi:hypothetical protein
VARGSDPYTARHRQQRVAADADQAEFSALVGGGLTNVEAGVYDDRLSGALEDEALDREEHQPGWQSRDLEYDDLVGRIAEEVQRRANIMGKAYPFVISDGRLEYTGTRTGFYEFCLAICSATNITEGDFVQLPRFFERVVALLVRGYLGTDSEALHTGSPRDKSIGTRFFDFMRTLRERSGEWVWDPEDGLPREPSTTGDEGVDFVVWKKTLDGRPGQIFLLGQCACGNDWSTKFNDLDLEKLYKWVRPRLYPEPVRLFATPYHLVDGHLTEAQRLAGLVLDRTRLSILAEKLADDPELVPWHQQLRDAGSLVLKPLGA